MLTLNMLDIFSPQRSYWQTEYFFPILYIIGSFLRSSVHVKSILGLNRAIANYNRCHSHR